VLRLASETEQGWVAAMVPHLDTLLLDHAHCEKKAASTAVNLIFRYQPLPDLMAPLSALAREELEHFEQVLALLEARGAPFGPLAPSAYASQLYAEVRSPEPERLLDTLLVCALIEARSCERMTLLAEALPDDPLRAFYRGLLASEARHHATYVDLALRRHDKALVFERLGALAQHEAAVLASVPREPRVHSRAPGAV
jgi:tRNA 2-(methylsulfanyl)-N6-isopentenyladenosine37 hydroxylase